MQTKQTEISQKQSEQTKIFKISYYIISEVLMNEMIKRIEVRCTLNLLEAYNKLIKYINYLTTCILHIRQLIVFYILAKYVNTLAICTDDYTP